MLVRNELLTTLLMLNSSISYSHDVMTTSFDRSVDVMNF